MHLNLIILTDFHSFTVNEEKLQNSQFSSFLLRSGYAILVKIWKWLKLLNSLPFIKKRLLNHVYIRIWSSWLTFTVSQGMKANIKISQFSRFLLRSEYPIQVKIRVRSKSRSEYAIQIKIWKWLNLLNSVPFIKKPRVNQVCFWIWSFWLTFTVLQWMKKNSKNSQFSSFLLRSRYTILVKIWKWLKLLILLNSSRKGFWIMFIFEFDHLDWLSQFHREWRQTSKLVNFQDLC